MVHLLTATCITLCSNQTLVLLQSRHHCYCCSIALNQSVCKCCLYCLSCTDLRVQFDPDSYTVAEGNQAQFRVMLNGEADRPVSVTFNTVAGTATGESIRTETQFRNFQSPI